MLSWGIDVFCHGKIVNIKEIMKAEIVTPEKYEASGGDINSIIPIMGGNPYPKDWEEFKNEWEEEYWPKLEAIKVEITNKGLIGSLAMEVCNDIIFTFSDDSKAMTFSFRAWGDLMDAIIGEKNGYISYY